MSFVAYDPSDSVVSSEVVVRGLWSGDNLTLQGFFTSSFTEYYLDVYNLNPQTNNSSSIQFDIQYGNISGSGSQAINQSVPQNSPSRIIYGQYRTLVYGLENTSFNFTTSSIGAQDIFVINISRSRYKESLLGGSFNLTLASGSNIIQLTDDSNTTSLTRFIGSNIYYNVIAGTNGVGNTSQNYGIVLPDLGIVILDPNLLGPYITPINRGTSTQAYNNHLLLYQSILAGNFFQLKSQETISSNWFFTRVKNQDFNYTTNPSIIDTNGNLIFAVLVNNPQTYITTVGLYNNNNELLAVAKLSKPLVKDFTKEALIRVKLDY